MSSAPARALLAIALAALLGALVGPAHASLIAEGQDPAGDATSPQPGHDLLDIGLGYDRREGRLSAAFRLRGEPDDGGFVTLVAATRDAAGSCTGAAVGVATSTDGFDGSWHRFANPSQTVARGELRKSGIHAAIQRLHVDDKGAAGVRPDCLIASITDPANPAIVYDTAGPIALKAYPSLAMKLTGVPETVRAGRSHRLRITVSNPGDAPTGSVRIRLPLVKGVKLAKRTVKLKAIPAGGSRSTRVRVTFGKRASGNYDLEARVQAGELKAEENVRVFVRRKRSKPPRGGSDGGTVTTCVEFFPDLSGETGGSLGLVPCVR